MTDDTNHYKKFADAPLTKETVRQAIKTAVMDNSKDVPSEVKQETAKVMLKFVEEGICPTQSMKLNDRDIANMYSYAYSLFNSGKYDEAKNMFLYLVNIVPNYASFANSLAACYHKMKQYDKAIEYYLTAAYMDEESPLYYFFAYDCFNELGDYLSCLEVLTIAIVRGRKDPKYAKLVDNALAIVDALAVNHPELFVRTESNEAKQ